MFWDNVRLLLSQQKILQKDFAEQMGYNVSTLKNQMTRNISPDVYTAVKIAKALGTSVEFLVTGEESNKDSAELKELKTKVKQFLTELL